MADTLIRGDARGMVAFLPLSLLSILAVASFGGDSKQDGPRPAKSPTPQPPTPEHAKLELFLGPWEVVETHFDEQGSAIATIKGNEDVKWILDQHAVQRTYASGREPNVYRAIGTLTYSTAEMAYLGTWFDNATLTGPMYIRGTWDHRARSMAFTSESKVADGSVVRHQTVERFPDPQTRLVTTYLLRGTEVVKTLESRCRRTAPCPAGIGRVFDGE